MLAKELKALEASAVRVQAAWRKAAWRLKKIGRAVTVARNDERSKAKQHCKEKIQQAEQNCKQKIAKHEASVRGDVEAEFTDALSRARKRARKNEAGAALAEKQSERLKEQKDELDEVKQKLDDVYEGASELGTGVFAAQREALTRLQSMPTWQRKRQAGRGGGRAFDLTYRRAIYAQYANCTPRSAISDNIVSIVKTTAPWLDPT